MSPEQAKGKVVDKRSDVWAFGAVIYEMLTGRRAFPGESVSETIAAVLTQDVDLDRLPADVPPSGRRLLRRCFERTPQKRFRDMTEGLLLIEEELGGHPTESAASIMAPSRVALARSVLPWVAAIALTVALAAAALVRYWPAPGMTESVRFAVATPAPLDPFSLAVSPDGRYVAFVAGNSRRLFVRPVEAVEARPLAGTEGAGYTPFWSPDSQHIGFRVGGTLKRIALAGGPPQDIAEIRAQLVGGTWNAEGDIVFSSGTALSRVPASGGEPVELIRGGWTPWFLPDGRRFLFTGRDGVYVQSPGHTPGIIATLSPLV